VRTVWVLGDQLDRRLGALGSAEPGDARVLVVESRAKLRSKRWHVQRAHLVVSALRHFVEELREAGFEVDHRRAESLEDGLTAHVAEWAPESVIATEPASWGGRRLLERLGVELVRSDQFLCHPDEFAAWADGRRRLKMEDFYRWQRTRLDLLMDDDGPVGGRWNFDDQNREPPPRGDHEWPVPVRDDLDEIDREVLEELRDSDLSLWGEDPTGVWATSSQRAAARLDHAIEAVLPVFGPHEDAMLNGNWHLSHTLLSPYLNLGMLRPGDVAARVDAAHRRGGVPIASAEGLLRQVIGWREYVWGLYWLWMPDYLGVNELDATRRLPPVFTGADTQMSCVASALGDVERYGWTHHIQRLMVLGNLCLLAGVRPGELVEWMWSGFVDGAEWVMLPNVIGMALHADGGRMATKPYAAGGAYIDRMSDHCKGCRYDRRARTGDDACPFTTLYWSFLDRHRSRFERNPRTAQQVRGLDRLGDLDEVRARSAEVLDLLDGGTL